MTLLEDYCTPSMLDDHKNIIIKDTNYIIIKSEFYNSKLLMALCPTIL